MIELVEAKSKQELLQFIKFPMQLYKGNPYYVPPFIKEELETLDQKKNPVFKNAQAQYFLAKKNGKIVGRVAAIINWTEIKEQNKKKMRFGWFDMIDDIEVTKVLLQKIEEIGKQNKLDVIEGPVGFSNLDKAGLLIKGYDKVATMVTLYNSPYYKKHLEELGYEKASEWVEYYFETPEEMPPKIAKFSDLIRKRYNLKVLKFRNTKEILPYVDPMFDLLDKTYSHLESYVPIKQWQIKHYKEKYVRFINPDFMICLANEKDELVSFAITMPSYSKALQKAKGNLFPFGWIHLLKASKKNDTAAFYLIGIDPKYQGKGVTAVIFSEMFKNFKKYGIKKLETNPELEENKNIQTLWSEYNPENHKRRRSYQKRIRYS